MSKKIQGFTSNKKSLLPWVVWGLGCLFYFYECLLQVSPSVMSNELMRDFNVTSQTLGILAAVYFYSYAAMQLPCGVLLDYFGPHRLLIIATTICALSTLLFGMSNSFFMACFARTMIGFGSAFAAIGTLKLAANWFPSQKFALLTGLMVTIGMLGAIGGEAPLAFLIAKFGWRQSMYIMGIIGIILTLCIIYIVKDTPTGKQIAHPRIPGELGIIASVIALIRNKQLWLIATYGGLMYLSTPVFCGLWGVPFLMTKMAISKAVAANYISLIFVGWAIAGPFWGIYSNRIGLRKPPLFIGAVGALITSLLFLYIDLNWWIMALVLLAFGVFSAGFLPSFAFAKEICNKRYVATGLSFMNMMNMIGIALVQPVIGFLLDYMWMGELVDNVRYYPLNAYQTALSILPMAIFISLIIMPLVKETYCQNVEDR